MNPNESGPGDPLPPWLSARRDAFEDVDLTFEVMTSIRALAARTATHAQPFVRMPYLESPFALLGLIRAAVMFFFLLFPIHS